ncbi:MAG: hypothetical protein ABEJ92_01060 [Halobacteriales archaeon]
MSEQDELLNPAIEDPFADGVSRRRLLASSAAAGATAATAGCTASLPGGEDGAAPTVFVFNTGDMTVSVIDAETDELVTTTFLGATASFPANQYAPTLTDSDEDYLWLNVSSGVKPVGAGSLSTAPTIETGSGANWQELTPDGSTLVVSAREPAHKQFKIDADPGSDTFGEVLAELDRTGEPDTGEKNGPGPCDVTVGPDGAYAFVPDIYRDTLTVIDVDAFEIVAQVEVDPVGDADSVRPWMDTAAWDGDLLAVENNEGEHGTESIWDVSDPEHPEELARLTADDGLGALPLTSEIGPDSAIAYVFTPSSQDVTVVDLEDRAVADRIDLGGQAFVGTWEPEREKLYVPVQSTNEVKVIDHADRAVVDTIAVGAKPYGATAGTVRPETDASAGFMASLASLGLSLGGVETTYCVASCHCGSMDH